MILFKKSTTFNILLILFFCAFLSLSQTKILKFELEKVEHGNDQDLDISLQEFEAIHAENTLDKEINKEIRLARINLFRSRFSKKKIKHLENIMISDYIAGLPIQNHRNAQYVSTFYIGSQKKKYNVIFDTGSSIPWIFAKEAFGPQSNSTYQCKYSKTCVKLRDHWNNLIIGKIKYGRGKIIGHYYQDTLYITNQMKSQNQSFLNIFKIEEALSGVMYFNALVGLSFRHNRQHKSFNTLIDNLYKQGEIKKKVFAFYISNTNLDSKYKSALTIGGIDNKYMGEKTFHTCKLNSKLIWSIKINSVKLQTTDSTMTLPRLSTDKALIDSGTSYVVFPAQDYRHILYYLRYFNKRCSYAAKYRIILCNKDDNPFPEIVFNLDGKEYLLRLETYLARLSRVDALKLQFLPYNVIILGTSFMSSYYIKFDQDDRTISLAKAAHYS